MCLGDYVFAWFTKFKEFKDSRREGSISWEGERVKKRKITDLDFLSLSLSIFGDFVVQ